MSTLRVKKSFLRQVKVDDVMEELRAVNYFDKSHREMMACVKDTLAYKQMREVAVKHMFNTLSNTSGLPDAEAREEKKNQIARIGLLALQISSSMSKTISERLSQEAEATAKRVLKRLSDKSCLDSLNSRGKKRKQNDASSEILPIHNELKKHSIEASESDVSLGSISENSVSSVHTSGISSFEDEIVVSSEDEKGIKREKRISFKTAYKAYLGNEFSKVHNDNPQQGNDTSETSAKCKADDLSLFDTPEKSTQLDSSTPRPKRERRPNSKYLPEEM